MHFALRQTTTILTAFFLSFGVPANNATAETISYRDLISNECRKEQKSDCYADMVEVLISHMEVPVKQDVSRRNHILLLLEENYNSKALLQYEKIDNTIVKGSVVDSAINSGYYDFAYNISENRKEKLYSVATFSHLARKHLASGTYKRAQEMYDKAISASVSLNNQKSIDSLYKKISINYAEHSKFALANKYLSKIIDPDTYLHALSGMAKEAVKTGDRNIAKKWLTRLVAALEKTGVEGRRSFPHTISGMYFELNEVELARKVLKRFDGKEDDAFKTRLAVNLAKTGKFDHAFQVIGGFQNRAFAAKALVQVAGQQYSATQSASAINKIHHVAATALIGDYKDFYRPGILIDVLRAYLDNGFKKRAFAILDSLSFQEDLYRIYSALHSILTYEQKSALLSELLIRETRPIATKIGPALNLDTVKFSAVADNLERNELGAALKLAKSIQRRKILHSAHKLIGEAAAANGQPKFIVDNLLPRAPGLPARFPVRRQILM